MGLKYLALLAVSGTQAWAAAAGSSEPTKRQDTTAKYCPGGTEICFSEFIETASNIAYRIAIPDVSAAPFDILLQIVAPINTAGWAGVAWGGRMNGNPLTVAWPNGKSAIVSSRWSTQWEGGALDPNGLNNLAWAKNTLAVNSPASNTSSFGYHDGRGTFYHDLNAAKIPKGVFDAMAYGLNNPGGVAPSSSSTAGGGVSTAVTTVPKPTTTPSKSQPPPSSSKSGPPVVVVTTRVVELPKPSTTTSTSPVLLTKPPLPTTGTTKKTTAPGTVTLTSTARPPKTTTAHDDDGWGEWPPWTGGGGGPPWGKGKGKGRGGRWGRRDRLAARPEE
ncbi:hypothetical protein C8A00DRAFT_46990 [Chaetomidium leptoderma]|uniref:Cellobiose dehydrogenase-like cytochrome domain-containing protein n=1 Tax=Chaetomidium leptoderma TaxID=669021 RepID=A0AAN6ZSL0_9PEZI|nr:hypothetical protein C8A00DRAFT_46990 [Chaetomidium leptoderma]